MNAVKSTRRKRADGLDGKYSNASERLGERRLVKPFRCRVWTQHSRPDEQLTEQACKTLRDSIEKHGQHQPVLGRPVTDDSAYDVEIICGARRHAAALLLGRDLLVEVRTISDAEAYVAMYEENAQRKDDCPYVQGQILRRALLSGTCASQGELAVAFHLSHSRVSRLLMVAQLPSVVIAAFPSPNDIRESWGVALYTLWKKNDPEHAITARARSLADMHPRLSPRDVYQALTSGCPRDSAKQRLNRSLPVRGANGKVLFHQREHIKSVIFIVPKAALNSGRHAALTQAISHILDEPHPSTSRDCDDSARFECPATLKGNSSPKLPIGQP